MFSISRAGPPTPSATQISAHPLAWSATTITTLLFQLVSAQKKKTLWAWLSISNLRWGWLLYTPLRQDLLPYFYNWVMVLKLNAWKAVYPVWRRYSCNDQCHEGRPAEQYFCLRPAEVKCMVRGTPQLTENHRLLFFFMLLCQFN